MAKTKKQTKSSVSPSRKNSVSLLSQVKWGESYTSLFLGAVVVIVALVLVFSFLKDRNNMLKQTSSTSTVNQQVLTLGRPKTYTVKANDDLWHIAQNIYGSGYNWVDIAKANNLTNPSYIFTGNVLLIPDVKEKMTEVDSNTSSNSPPVDNKIIGTSYKIQKGDDLWDMAVRAYGDGYKWVDIAKANGYTNPDIINVDNTVILPR